MEGLVSTTSKRVRPMRMTCVRHVFVASRRLGTLPPDPPAPPLLLKLRGDMKAAMKAKDINRLNVLRSILAETTNAAKTSSPLKTDVQLLALLRKRAAASRAAAQEFDSVKRADLRDKEMAQAAVMEEYASGVETISEDEITTTIQDVTHKMKANGQNVNIGSLLKALVGPGGAFDGKAVENVTVARLAKEML